ncbi:hypothetical protein Vafri_8513, partial [Volvox africanus]
MAPSNSEQVFGLTAVDMAAASSSPPGAANGAAAALPEIPVSMAQSTYLTESAPTGFMSPKGAAAAAAAISTTSTSSNRAPKSLAPIPPTPPTPPQLSPQITLAIAATPGQAANGRGSISGSARRLPPISSSAAAGVSGPPGATSAPAQERNIQALTTPMSRMVTPLEANTDTRNFDSKDLHEAIKISWQDYSDVARVQRMVELGLSSHTTEASRAEALLQIREASLQNPLFSITPIILGAVREDLLSRNRLLRPAAAYALAGYAAYSRYGRGLMTVHANELLPRLNSMLRCRVDSMDARYAALAVLSASTHVEHKEIIGKSGSIPLLLNLIRQNIGRTSPAPANHAEAMEYLIGTYDNSERSTAATSSLNSLRPDSSDSSAQNIYTPRKPGIGFSHSYTPGGSYPSSGVTGDPPQFHSAPLPGYPSIASAPSSPFTLEQSGLLPYHGDGVHGHGGGGSPALRGFGGLGTGGGVDLPTSPSKGAYLLHVKPAAAHAVAALVNLAEVASNRQRMREANIASVLEDVMLSRNENLLKERCRLLIDLFQMDTNRFKEAANGAEMYAVASVSQTVVNFIQRG